MTQHVLQIWDPDFGPDGQYRDATDEELIASQPPEIEEEVDAVADIPPTAFDGILNENFIVYDPETGAPAVTTDPVTGQQNYTLQPDLIGGSISDPRIGIPGVNDGVTLPQLDTRRTSLSRGFTGDFDDAREGNYLTDAKGQRGLVDRYGYKTASGQLEDVLDSPTANMTEGAVYNASSIDPNAAGTVMDASDDRMYINTLPSVQQQSAVASDVQNVAERVAIEYEALEQFNAVSEQKAAAALINDQIQLITAQQEEVTDMSTVRGQLTRLSSEFEGGVVPPWAAGAIGAAQQVMAARGLGASSIASNVITTSAMGAMMPIALNDAGIYAEFQRLNLNNRQQAEIQNAANLLTTDLKDVDNKQQVAIFNMSNRVQSLMTDQSEVNAARRINASTVNQTNQFFAGLQQSVLTTNSAQQTAISQFNAGQGNALEQFRATQSMNQQQYNATNYTVIKQANATWARQTATANTAAINAQNQFNATNVYNKSSTALNNKIQIMRDQADFSFNAAQNDEQRKTNLAVATLQAEAARQAASPGGKSSGASFLKSAGGLLGNIFANWAGTESGSSTITDWLPWTN